MHSKGSHHKYSCWDLYVIPLGHIENAAPITDTLQLSVMVLMDDVQLWKGFLDILHSFVILLVDPYCWCMHREYHFIVEILTQGDYPHHPQYNDVAKN